MRLFDRFTRDEVSAKVWWPLALVGLVALIVSVPLANREAERTRSDAAQRASEASLVAIQPLASSGASASELSAAAASIVAADPTLSAVRVWDAAYDLVASSDGTDAIGSGEAMNDQSIDQALTAGTEWLVTDRTMAGDAGPTTFYAYTAIQGADGDVVTEFEAADAAVLADVHHDWMWFRIVVGLGSLFVFALALLSMREPFARIGAGVPFYADNVPPWLRVMDVDRAVALEQAGDRAKGRLAGLQARLDESERSRLQAEGELQQALTALGTGGRATTPVVVPEPGPTHARASRPSPEAAAAAVATAEEKKRARAAAAQEKQRAKAAAASSEAAPPVARPATEPPPRTDEVTVMAEDLTITASPAPAGRADTDEPTAPVVVPEPEPATVAAGSATSGPDSDREARDVLERLVPETAEHPPADDTSDLRSRLARTAALKKPGSRERKEGREDLQH